jgi:hypothetical protein
MGRSPTIELNTGYQYQLHHTITILFKDLFGLPINSAATYPTSLVATHITIMINTNYQTIELFIIVH